MRAPLGSRAATLGMFGVGMATAMGGQMAGIKRQQRFDPSKLYRNGEKGVWYDPSDFSSMYQDSAGTTAVTATTQPVGKVADKSGRANSATQSTTTSRPTEQGPPFAHRFDGVDDGYRTSSFAAGTLTNNMDCFVAFNRGSSGSAVPIFGDGSSKGFAIWQSANGGTPDAGSGAPAYLVDGIQLSANTRDALNTAMTAGAWHVLEARNLDLSSWLLFGVGNWPGGGFILNADMGGLILCPAQSADIRSQIRTWLGAKVGLSL